MSDEDTKPNKARTKSQLNPRKSFKKSIAGNKAVKRPPSAYFLFCKKMREEFKKKTQKKNYQLKN